MCRSFYVFISHLLILFVKISYVVELRAECKAFKIISEKILIFEAIKN